jgi:hypothetical protein
MILDRIVHTCSHPAVAHAALASIGGEFAARFEARASRHNVSPACSSLGWLKNSQAERARRNGATSGRPRAARTSRSSRVYAIFCLSHSRIGRAAQRPHRSLSRTGSLLESGHYVGEGLRPSWVEAAVRSLIKRVSQAPMPKAERAIQSPRRRRRAASAEYRGRAPWRS